MDQGTRSSGLQVPAVLNVSQASRHSVEQKSGPCRKTVSNVLSGGQEPKQ